MKTLISILFLCTLIPRASAELVTTLSSQLNDYNFNISSRYNVAVFARSEHGFNNAKIWQVDISQGNEFSIPQQLHLGPEKYRYSDPMLSADGKTLLFISDRPLTLEDKSDDYNIWQASLIQGQWTNIHALAGVNSEADELGPEMHNGILYFSSARDGKLSLYQSDTRIKTVNITAYQEITHKSLAQSDLTFSPDGNIAVFWQLSADKKDSLLMMQLRTSQGWGQARLMPNQVQSSAFEFTPQFSPDGQWLYISSARSVEDYQQLNIHRFAAKEIFPSSWYQQSLSSEQLDILANREKITAIQSFEYDLLVKRGNSEELVHTKMKFNPLQVQQVKGEQVIWFDAKEGYKTMGSGDKQVLPEDERQQLLKAVRYNFFHLLKQQSTELFQQYATRSERGRLYRVNAHGLSAFSVLLNEDKNIIEQLRYDDLATGLEQDYQLINGVFWPMQFEFIIDEKVVAQGKFTNAKIVISKG